MDYVGAMTTFEEFTRARYATLQKERGDLYRQLRVIQKELEEIERAARASGLQLVKEDTLTPQTKKPTQKRNFTMKEASVEILGKHPNGLTATEILPELNKLIGSDYARSSLSPQLSRLKKDGVIYDINGIWTLVKEAPEHQ
jgi:hypothetical protein